jgi:O-antigen ligase
MTTTSLPRRLGGVGGHAGAVMLGALACVVGVAAGRVAISHYGGPAIEALIALPILIYAVRRPMIALILLLALVSSVFPYGLLPRVKLPGNPPLNAADVVLAVTVAGTVWRRPWRTWPVPVRRFFVVLCLMLLLAAIPTIRLAMHGHSAAREAILGYKTLLYLIAALTIALELSGRLWRTLLGVLTAFAALVSILSIAAAASSGVAHILTQLDPTAALSQSGLAAGPTARIRLPGLFLAYAMLVPVLVMTLTVSDRWRTARIATLGLIIAAIAVSLNRNMYFGGLIAILIAVLIGGPRLRHRFILTALAVAATLAIVVQSAVLPAVTAKVTARAASALSTQVISTGSAQARADEFSHAFTAIAQHPWYGVGWFQNYGSYSGGTFRLGVEDWYLHIATDLGIPVAVGFMLIVVTVLAFGFGRARAAPRPQDRALASATLAAVVALLLSCLVGSYLQDPGSMMVFGIGCALVLAAGMQTSPARRPSDTDGAGEATAISAA